MFCLVIGLLSLKLAAQEVANYGDIKIKADVVTLDKLKNELILRKNLQINFGSFILSGDNAVLSYQKKKLMIDGAPASISSEENNIHGTADSFIIYPNLSIEMLGNAELFKNNRSIYSEHITYQIDLND